MIDTERILENLNEAQREAVLATEGPLLILAGAGSGKTRVITHRLAYVIASGRALPHEVVAVTFTNKAAGEMKERIAKLLGPDAGGARIGTFHALCLRILRRDGGRIDVPAGFQVYDTADQLGVVRAVLKELGVDEAELSPRAVLSRISHAKNRRLGWEDLARTALPGQARTVAICYEAYQKRLHKLGALDFDDLIVETLRLLDSRREVGARYARGCRYLLVDEYQDTNRCQYDLVRALAAEHRNVCCVADPDQSIYRFRGADTKNIAEFEEGFPDTRIVKLERNYRSTKTILRAAGAVIANNDRRHAKSLWTENEDGQPIHYHRSRDDRDEAEAVVRILGSLAEAFPGGETAVLYRTNNQSRLIEEALVQHGIPYRIVGSLRFYERKEIKDLLSYLRLLVVPDDDPAFLRAANTPPRGIGKGTLDQLAELAAGRGLSLHGAARLAVDEALLAPRAVSGLGTLLATLESLRETAEISVRAPSADQDGGAATGGDDGLDTPPQEPADVATAPLDTPPQEPAGVATAPPVVPLVTELLRAIGFRDHLQKAHPGDFGDRLENVDALVSAAAEFDEVEPGAGLQSFLDRTSLRGDTDDVQGSSGLTLLTVHSAKGLEFSAIVLVGMEENLFPHVRSSESSEDLEEERRLCYVAITRAKKRLVITNAVMRRSFGDFVENPPSRFLEEIPKEVLALSESSAWSGVVGDPLRSQSNVISAAGRFSRASRAAQGSSPSFARESYRDRTANRRFRGSGRSVEHDPGDDFAVGRTVTHPMFGQGKILSKEGAGDTLKLTIRFLHSGTRKILPRHTTLLVHD